MLKLKNIQVVFNKGTVIENKVLKGLDLEIQDGEFVTIIGGNGAGKSTLMNVISGEITHNTGKVYVDQEDVSKFPTQKRAKYIARVFQDPMTGTFPTLTIEENLSLALNRGRRRSFGMALGASKRGFFKEVLAELNIGLESRLQDEVALLSGGQRQALSLLMATLDGSKLLMLDEHTAALDPKMAKLVLKITKKLVEKSKLTTLMITHSMSQALEFGDRTIMLYHGEIVKDMRGKERSNLDPSDLLKFFDL